MVSRFLRTSIGLKLLVALLALGFILRLLVVLFSLNSEGQIAMSVFDGYVGFSSKESSYVWLWSWLTYSFFHAEVSHFVWNYVLLFLLIFWSNSRFMAFSALKCWLIGVVFGIVFMFLHNPSFSLIGASAGIVSLWTAWLVNGFMHVSKRGNSFWMGAVVFLLLEVIDILNYEVNNASLFAHLGGLFGGVLFVLLESKLDKKMKWIEKFFAWFTPSPKLKVKRSNKRFQTDEEFNEEKRLREEYLNSILEKISRSGYESLSMKEKSFLLQQQNEK